MKPMENTETIKLKSEGFLLRCTDPENCGQEHNEISGWETEDDRMHHYGCDCDSCFEFYRSLK